MYFLFIYPSHNDEGTYESWKNNEMIRIKPHLLKYSDLKSKLIKE